VLQYRNDAGYGFWRSFNETNGSRDMKSLYLVETAVHEMMLQVRAPCGWYRLCGQTICHRAHIGPSAAQLLHNLQREPSLLRWSTNLVAALTPDITQCCG
jgi:hypothetical protein